MENTLTWILVHWPSRRSSLAHFRPVHFTLVQLSRASNQLDELDPKLTFANGTPFRFTRPIWPFIGKCRHLRMSGFLDGAQAEPVRGA